MLSRYFRAYSHRSIGVPCFWMINDEYHLDFVLEDINTKDVFLVGTTDLAIGFAIGFVIDFFVVLSFLILATFFFSFLRNITGPLERIATSSITLFF